MKLISACLVGVPCRYDGRPQTGEQWLAALAEGNMIPVCPEIMGGLAAPRIPCEIVGGDGYDVLAGRARVVNREGRDVTEAFVKGARAVVELCCRHGVDEVILKANSPSCGCGVIYDGTFSGGRTKGDGVACAALKKAGYRYGLETNKPINGEDLCYGLFIGRGPGYIGHQDGALRRKGAGGSQRPAGVSPLSARDRMGRTGSRGLVAGGLVHHGRGGEKKRGQSPGHQRPGPFGTDARHGAAGRGREGAAAVHHLVRPAHRQGMRPDP